MKITRKSKGVTFCLNTLPEDEFESFLRIMDSNINRDFCLNKSEAIILFKMLGKADKFLPDHDELEALLEKWGVTAELGFRHKLALSIGKRIGKEGER